MIYDILIIATLCCFIVNSGAVDSIKRLIWRWVKGKAPYQYFSLKPFDCELCLTWWCGTVYLLCVGEFTLANTAIVALCAWLTPVIVDLMHLMQAFPEWLIGKLHDKMR